MKDSEGKTHRLSVKSTARHGGFYKYIALKHNHMEIMVPCGILEPYVAVCISLSDLGPITPLPRARHVKHKSFPNVLRVAKTTCTRTCKSTRFFASREGSQGLTQQENRFFSERRVQGYRGYVCLVSEGGSGCGTAYASESPFLMSAMY